MTTPKIILFNAPPRAGKDTGADYVTERLHLYNPANLKLAAVLKDMTHRLYGLGNIKFNHFEDVKDQPRAEFLGITPRDAYINVAEKLLKPVHGQTIFSEMLIKQIKALPDQTDVVVISDLGFQQEIDYFATQFDNNDLLVVQIERDGCDYSKDSRETVKVPNTVQSYILQNNSTLDKYYEDLEIVIDHVIKT